MKLFIPTYNRPETIKSHKLFEWNKFKPTIVYNNEEQKALYSKNEELQKLGIPELVSNSAGITGQRSFILDQINEGEWFMMIDDNIKRFDVARDHIKDNDYTREQVSKNFNLRREFFREEPMTEMELYDAIQEMIEMAEEKGYKHAGLSIMDNPRFRNKRISTWVFMVGKVSIIQKSHLRYDKNLEMMEDYGWTMENLKEFDGVIRNNRIIPVSAHHQGGGLGDLKSRIPSKIIECQYLLEKYPGMARINNSRVNKGCEIVIKNRPKSRPDNYKLF